jgi:hypothetical protein
MCFLDTPPSFSEALSCAYEVRKSVGRYHVVFCGTDEPVKQRVGFEAFHGRILNRTGNISRNTSRLTCSEIRRLNARVACTWFTADLKAIRLE